MSINCLKSRISCLILRLLFRLRIQKKGGPKHYANSWLYYILGKLQNTTLIEFDLREPGSKLLEDVPLVPDLWMNFLSSLSPSSEEQWVENLHQSSVTIFSAKSGKLLLSVEYEDLQ